VGDDEHNETVTSPRAELAKVIPRRPRVSFWLGMALALAFALIVTPAVTAERWLTTLGMGQITKGQPAPITLRVAPFSGKETREAHIGGGGVVIQRGMLATREQADNAAAVRAATPVGPLPYVAFFVLALVFAAIFTHHMRRSTKGRLVRVQVVNLVTIAALAIAVKVVMLTTSVSILVVPVALLALVPTMVLDRVVGLATGILGALVVSLLIPFDVSVAVLLLVQAATAGLVVAEHPKSRWRAAISAGAVATFLTVGTVVLLTYMTTGALPRVGDPWNSPLVAAAIGPALATLIAVPTLPLYQLLVGEITQGKLIELEDLSHPLLKQIAEKSPGTWQHSLMMANMAEIAANAIGASGRLVRVGAYFHDLGKSLQPKYFIENLEPGETSPHDQLPPEVSCDAIFAHVTEGIVTARRSGLHERIVDFMHMHHGNGVLEYFWSRCKEQGNPKKLTIENYRYPGHPPQSRETAILAICDAVEAASRTLKKPDAQSIDSLVQRIVYGKLHLGQLDESGLSMSDLRRISDSLRETIRHANHGRIEYPWQKAQQDASATVSEVTGTQPRLDSLDRKPRAETAVKPQSPADSDQAIILDRPSRPSGSGKINSPDATATTADFRKPDDLSLLETAPGTPEPVKVAFRSRPTTQAGADSSPAPLAQGTAPMRPRTESERSARPRTESELSAPVDSQIRKRAATIPPIARAKPPSVQPQTIGDVTIPPMPTASTSLPAVEPLLDQPPMRASGPPQATDLENAITNPPPLRRTMMPPIGTRLPAFMGHAEDDAHVTAPRMPIAREPSSPFEVEDAGRTEPSLPKVALPLQPPPPSNPQIRIPRDAPDEWSMETPVVAPTKAELRALMGGPPDVTREQSIEEIDRLHLAARALQSDPEILPPPAIPETRRAPITAEVRDEDIEAAIELAPPARKSAIAVAKPKKPQP
jgi:putative nucleotidyltransferase with HDIG domain